jgi:hypothetical protein
MSMYYGLGFWEERSLVDYSVQTRRGKDLPRFGPYVGGKDVLLPDLD